MNDDKNYFEKELYTLNQAETENLISLKEFNYQIIPFGYINDQWEELKILFEDGDLLYKFINKKDKLSHLEQKIGFELIRNNKIIYTITTELN